MSWFYPRYWSARLGLKLLANDPMPGLPPSSAAVGRKKLKVKEYNGVVAQHCPFMRLRDIVKMYARTK